MAYAKRKDVYALGLPPAAFVRAPRTVEAVDPATETFTLRGHGLETGRVLTFALQGSAAPVLGAPASALPTGLSASVVYYAIKLSEDLFQVSTTLNGSVFALSDVGSGVFGIALDFGADLDAQLESTAGDIDVACAAHRTPFLPDLAGAFPAWLVGLNARLAAADSLIVFGLQNPAYEMASKRILDRVDTDRGDMAFWKKGQAIPGMNARDATPLVAEMSAASFYSEPQDWYDVNNGGYLA